VTGQSRDDGLIRLMPAVFVLIWSTGFIVARYGMPNSPPFKFLVVRYGLSILCFLPWIWGARVKWPQTGSQWLHLCVTGLLMHAGYLGGVWAAVKAGMGSGLAALIVGVQPILTAIWLSMLGNSGVGGPVNRRQWMGLTLGFAGLAMVVSRKFGEGSPGDMVNSVNLAYALGALVSITAGERRCSVVNKTELIEHIANPGRYFQGRCHPRAGVHHRCRQDHLKKGGSVSLVGFGTSRRRQAGCGFGVWAQSTHRRSD
jgi:drug/metabolite transporter (DMT)-like permease